MYFVDHRWYRSHVMPARYDDRGADRGYDKRRPGDPRHDDRGPGRAQRQRRSRPEGTRAARLIDAQRSRRGAATRRASPTGARIATARTHDPLGPQCLR
ncbi:MAG: hypothetical protein MZW92_10625 [Comamonadaceae bacterium]|nr:hypothetical protein [Comamonadaceae bacterium]